MQSLSIKEYQNFLKSFPDWKKVVLSYLCQYSNKLSPIYSKSIKVVVSYYNKNSILIGDRYFVSTLKKYIHASKFEESIVVRSIYDGSLFLTIKMKQDIEQDFRPIQILACRSNVILSKRNRNNASGTRVYLHDIDKPMIYQFDSNKNIVNLKMLTNEIVVYNHALERNIIVKNIRTKNAYVIVPKKKHGNIKTILTHNDEKTILVHFKNGDCVFYDTKTRKYLCSFFEKMVDNIWLTCDGNVLISKYDESFWYINIKSDIHRYKMNSNTSYRYNCLQFEQNRRYFTIIQQDFIYVYDSLNHLRNSNNHHSNSNNHNSNSNNHLCNSTKPNVPVLKYDDDSYPCCDTIKFITKIPTPTHNFFEGRLKSKVSSDGRHVLSICEKVVRIYCVASTDCIATFQNFDVAYFTNDCMSVLMISRNTRCELVALEDLYVLLAPLPAQFIW